MTFKNLALFSISTLLFAQDAQTGVSKGSLFFGLGSAFVIGGLTGTLPTKPLFSPAESKDGRGTNVITFGTIAALSYLYGRQVDNTISWGPAILSFSATFCTGYNFVKGL